LLLLLLVVLLELGYQIGSRESLCVGASPLACKRDLGNRRLHPGGAGADEIIDLRRGDRIHLNGRDRDEVLEGHFLAREKPGGDQRGGGDLGRGLKTGDLMNWGLWSRVLLRGHERCRKKLVDGSLLLLLLLLLGHVHVAQWGLHAELHLELLNLGGNLLLELLGTQVGHDLRHHHRGREGHWLERLRASLQLVDLLLDVLNLLLHSLNVSDLVHLGHLSHLRGLEHVLVAGLLLLLLLGLLEKVHGVKGFLGGLQHGKGRRHRRGGNR